MGFGVSERTAEKRLTLKVVRDSFWFQYKFPQFRGTILQKLDCEFSNKIYGNKFAPVNFQNT